MKKIIELLKADLLDILRRPANVFFAVIMILGILFLTGFVLNTGTTADIIASYAIFISAYTGFIMTSMAVLTDRDRGLYRMYRSSRLSKAEYLTSKISYTGLSLLLSGLILVIGFFTSEIFLSWLIAPILLLSVLAHAGIGLLIPAFVETTQEAQRIVQILFFAMVFLSPVFYTSEGLPQIVQLLQQIVPLTHGVEAMRIVMVDGNGVQQVWRQLTVLAGLTTITFSISYRKLEF